MPAKRWNDQFFFFLSGLHSLMAQEGRGASQPAFPARTFLEVGLMIPVVSRLGLPRSLCLLLFIEHMEQIELLSASSQEAELRATEECNKHLQRKSLELVQDISIWILALSIHEHGYLFEDQLEDLGSRSHLFCLQPSV